MDFVADFFTDHVVEILITLLAYLSGQQGVVGKISTKIADALSCKGDK